MPKKLVLAVIDSLKPDMLDQAVAEGEAVLSVATGWRVRRSQTVIAPAGRESETIGLVLTGWTLSMVAGVLHGPGRAKLSAE